MRNLKQKIENPEISIFPVMSKLCKEHNAINLAQGFPGFSADTELLDKIDFYTKKGFNQYAPLMGDSLLRKTVTGHHSDLYRTNYDWDKECIIVAGATQGIYTALTTIVSKGDEVIIIEPAYDCYAPSIQMIGGKAVPVEMEQEMYTIDWVKVRKKCNENTVGIIINNPHNPTGKILKEEDLTQLESIVLDFDLYILADEVYEHITFDGKPHLSIGSYPNLKERAFLIYSFGKTYHVTGWRAGCVFAPEPLMQKFVFYHQFQIYAVNTPIQKALADYAQEASKHTCLSSLFETKRNLFLKHLEGSKFTPIYSEGTYFILLDYSNITEKTDRPFAEQLIKENGIGSIPISPFYSSKRQDQVLRFCFAKTDEEIIAGAKVLKKVN